MPAVPLNYVAVEDALHTWVSGASGLKTIWGEQEGPYPSYPHCTLKVIGTEPIGDDYVQTYDAGRPLNQEIEKVVRSWALITLSIQAASDKATGANRALAILHRVRTHLGKDSVRNALKAAGLGPLPPGPVQDITELFASEWESRAVMECRFRCKDELAEYLGIFRTVRGTITLQPGPEVVPFEVVKP